MKALFVVLLVVMVLLISGCELPREGSLEYFTLSDIFSYMYKLTIGPIFRNLPENFSMEKVTEASHEKNELIFFTLIGDIMFTRDIDVRLYEFYPEVLKDSDLTIANLEFPINPSKGPSGFHRFNGTEEFFDRVVLPLEPDVVNIANNHCLDQGIEGLYSTMEVLEKHGIAYTGVRKESKRYITLECNGIRVAVTGFTFSTNGRKDQGDEMVNRLRLNAYEEVDKEISPLLDIIKKMREEAEIIIIILHWGFEYEYTPTKNQVHIAHTFIDAGADLVIGHHPHVLQDFEYYKSANGHSGMIFYSLGNWTTAMKPVYTRTTAAIRVSLDKDGKVITLDAYPFLYTEGKFVPLKAVESNKYIPRSIKDSSVW
ncbi:CapA family protein [Kosmotoga pacifica]|uniref:CapA family protein n=1 Tax=Kosmotoga pacifica TaxID=1330330 RepID=UPI00069AEF21|nr:CapA family protein [Kosmotoga pacifica]